MEDKKVLLSIKDLDVKFRVRGRTLTAIRGISLDIYENESIAIVGESGSGKSVFTKTFAGMLDSNGFIDNGSIVFNDDELSDTVVKVNSLARALMDKAKRKLDEYSHLELGAATYQRILALESEKKEKSGLSGAETAALEEELKELQHQRTDVFNLKQTYDPAKEKDKIHQANQDIKNYDARISELKKKSEQLAREKKHAVSADVEYMKHYQEEHARLQAQYEREIKGEVSDQTHKRNEILAKEIYLSVGRYGLKKRVQFTNQLLKAFKKAMQLGVDIDDDAQRNAVFDNVAFRVRYLDETPEQLHGICVLNLANVKYSKDWTKIRGRRIATVFQDPMTSLNPIITIGRQITSVILKHQDCTEAEARRRALELMHKVGIPNAAARFDDYPFHAPAYRHRHRPVLPAQDPDLRRAHHRVGRDHPGPDPPADQGFAERVQLHHRVYHPRPGRGGKCCRPGGGAVRRAGHRAGHGARGVLRPAAPLYLGAAVFPAPAGPEKY